MMRIILALTLATSAACAAAAQQPQANSADIGQSVAPRAITTDEAMEKRVAEVASQLRCVVCQGQALQDSPSELAQQMRDVIREQLVAGKTPDEVKDYFVAKYGEWILLEPQPHGFNILAWVLPPLLLVGGGAGLVMRMRRWTREAGQPSS